jgi:hypothetical protein
MAGESAHFGLRQRPPTPAIRPFDLMPRLRSMLDQANTGLAQPFRGVTGGDGIVAGLFPLAKTGMSLASVVEAARSLLATLTAEQRKAACFAIGDGGMAEMVEYPPLADAPWRLPHGSRA